MEAWGHENVKATHRTTFEITKEEFLTPRGDCIIGVRASKSVAELDSNFKNILRRDSAILVIILEAGGCRDVVLARGSTMLQLSDSRKIIVRKSRYIEGATLGIEANKAARDLSRRLINALREPSTKLVVRLVAIDLSNVV